MSSNNIKKLYYSIGEVSKLTGLKQYVLRYWETEFPQLKPTKNSAGNRCYKSTHIELINERNNLNFNSDLGLDFFNPEMHNQEGLQR